MRRSASILATVAVVGALFGLAGVAVEGAAPAGSPLAAPAAGATTVAGGLGYTSLSTPCRAVDTRNAGGPLAPGGSRDFRMRGSVSFASQGGSASGCGVPTSATAVEVTLTAVTPTGANGFVQAFPAASSSRATVLNYTVGRSITNTGTIPLNTALTNDLGVANAGGTIQVIVDIQGYFTPTGGASYVPLPTPCRVADTRNGGGTLAAGTSREFRIRTETGTGFEAQGGTPGGCGIPDEANGVELSMSVTTPSVADGFVRVSPRGTDTNAAFANYTAGTSITNTGSVAMGASGPSDVVVRNFGGTTHVVLDVQGYYTPTPGQGTRYQTVAPCRTVDTRNAGGSLAPGQTRNFQTAGSRGEFRTQGTASATGCGVPQRAAAVEASLTAVSPSGVGFARPGPAGSIASATFLNYSPVGGITNTGTVPLARGGTTDLGVTVLGGATSLIVDVLGYYEPTAAFPGAAEQVSTAGGQSCLVVGGGQLRCWGFNTSGQVGDGSTINRAAPVPLTGLTGAATITTGEGHSCALFADGGFVRCWGSNFAGALGDGTTVAKTTPTNVSALTGAVQVTAGAESGHTCALIGDGTVRCWGRNDRGQVGDGTSGTNRSTPTTVTGLTGAIQVSVGGLHSCALIAGGTVRCWGFNTSGQLGDGTVTQRNSPVPVPGLSGVVQVAAGATHTCALLADGTARCWGDNEVAQIGDGTSGTTRPAPTAVSGLTGAVQLAAGEGSTCAVLAGGTARCWGDNSTGQVGDGTSGTTRPTPTAVTGLTGAVQLSAGGGSTCAVLADGTARCWGFNTRGTVGDGTVTQRNSPVAVAGLSGVVQVAAGGLHTCAVLASGTVRCWGNNLSGQVGDGSTSARLTPTSVPGLAGVVQVTAGDAHSCALVVDGTVRCWGNNSLGQVGNGTSGGTQLTPTPVTTLTGVIQVAAGGTHTCALLVDRTVRCWGFNASGQLGDGTLILKTGPVSVTGLTGATRIATGTNHTCAMVALDALTPVGGGARCWGANSNGQLGTGSTSPTGSSRPVTVSGLTGVADITAGGAHSCAVLTTGAARCWGDNSSAQIGDNTVTPRPSPTPVSEVFTAARISAGGANTCAVVSPGSISCWGASAAGSAQSLPTTVIPGGGTQVSEGGTHRCGIVGDGTLRCWGANGFGQVGDNTTTTRTTPVVVSIT